MWKFLAVLALAILCVHADEEKPIKTETKPSTLMEMARCYGTTKPINCLKEQTGRMLDYFESKVDEKRQKLLVEADEEAKKTQTARGLGEDETKERPSEVINTLDKSFSALASAISEEAANIRNRNGRNLPVDDGETAIEEARFKKKKLRKLHLLFSLGSMVKSKIDVLIKMLSFKLQLKFLAIAFINMIINIARFAIVDVKGHFSKGNSQPETIHDVIHEALGGLFKRQTPNQPEYTQDYANRLAYNNQYDTNTGRI